MFPPPASAHWSVSRRHSDVIGVPKNTELSLTTVPLVTPLHVPPRDQGKLKTPILAWSAHGLQYLDERDENDYKNWRIWARCCTESLLRPIHLPVKITLYGMIWRVRRGTQPRLPWAHLYQDHLNFSTSHPDWGTQFYLSPVGTRDSFC